jgi:hypothetical protein
MSFASTIKKKIMQRKLKKHRGQTLITPRMNLSGRGFGFMPTASTIGGTISRRPNVQQAIDSLENLSISGKKSNTKYKPLKFNF